MDHAARPELDAAALAAKLEQQFRERRPPPLLPGSQLAQLVNEALGEGRSFKEFFAPGEVPRLRTFVERYLPTLIQFTGTKQGADNMFSIPGEASTVELAHAGSLWRSFVAVRPAFKLVYNIKTASVATLSYGLPIPDDCVAIEPVTDDEHREFMRSFCSLLEGDGHNVAALKPITREPSEGLYQQWLAALRSRKPLDRTWGQFRRDKVLDLYEMRLLHAGATQDRAEQLRRELDADHEVARAPKAVAAASVAATVAAGGVTHDSREARERRARELLKLAADRLSYEQLLAVHLPLGAVLDLTGNSSGRE